MTAVLIRFAALGFTVLGLAVVLAQFSHAWFRAQRDGVSLAAHYAQPPAQLLFNSGLALAALGASVAASAWWGRVIWAAFVLAFAALAVLAWRSDRAEEDRQVEQPLREQVVDDVQQDRGVE